MDVDVDVDLILPVMVAALVNRNDTLDVIKPVAGTHASRPQNTVAKLHIG